MRKTRSKEGEKRADRRSFSLLPVILGAGLSFGLFFVLLFGVAALVWSGGAEELGLASALCAGLAALAGGRLAVRMGEGAALPAGLLSAVLFCIGLLALCVLYEGTVVPSRLLLSVLLLALAGGSLAGLIGRRKSRKRTAKR